MSTAIGYKESSFPESADIFDINIPEWPRPKYNGTLAEQNTEMCGAVRPAEKRFWQESEVIKML